MKIIGLRWILSGSLQNVSALSEQPRSHDFPNRKIPGARNPQPACGDKFSYPFPAVSMAFCIGENHFRFSVPDEGKTQTISIAIICMNRIRKTIAIGYTVA